ncbi:MAG TPA: FAD-dependent oxidoreductase [Alphaproteobacteria bacterium]|nr:FAD-dependent oxidoreductase [Alphaproteobacteria bacterium]
MRDPRFDILFEPVRIGPVVAKNRFYQPPHCNGMGSFRPQAHAAMRGVKAEGGWAVVNAEHCSIHPTSDVVPEVLHALWDDDDIPYLATMCDAVHAHGALAGVQLAYAAYYNSNRYSREVPMGPVARPVDSYYPVQARQMDKADIRKLHRWWGDAAKRARKAGFDIINVDANFSTVAFQFLSPRNTRVDEYGGSLKNRVRLLRELIEVTQEAAQGACAVSVRLIIDEMRGTLGLRASEDGIEAISLLADLPDLWDVVIGTWADDSPTSRFAPENDHEPFMAGIKAVTRKPVVGVGRFTSPDTMVSLIRRGILDMIGATRPSIADPFLPKKIDEGREDDIRECIGCNVCVSSHFQMTNLRCTQNPTMGEEWRKGWHPETIPPKGSEDTVLIVGSGPAGLECARALGQRGYRVTLAEREKQLGGRVSREASLPGLQEWLRVRDWRMGQLHKLANVEVYKDSNLSPADILQFGAHRVVLATGARWRADGIGRINHLPIPIDSGVSVITPDDVIDGCAVNGPVLVFDDDHYYMGSVLAEKLALAGLAVTLATPAPEIAAFTAATLELRRIAVLLDALKVRMITHHGLARAANGEAHLVHVHTDRTLSLAAATIVMVTARLPEDRLYRTLAEMPDKAEAAGIKSVTAIGDCLAPGAIFHAVYAGHRYARELDAPNAESAFKRERIALTD